MMGVGTSGWAQVPVLPGNLWWAGSHPDICPPARRSYLNPAAAPPGLPARKAPPKEEKAPEKPSAMWGEVLNRRTPRTPPNQGGAPYGDAHYIGEMST